MAVIILTQGGAHLKEAINFRFIKVLIPPMHQDQFAEISSTNINQISVVLIL